MTTRKVKRYNGEEDSDVSSFAGTPENDSNAGMTPEAGMMEKEPAENFKSAPKAKAPIVTKEELSKTGLSLREYMNQKQGLKPRGEKAAASTAKAETKPAASTESAPAAKRPNILEEAKAEARRRAAGASAYKKSQEPTMRAGDMPKRGQGLSAIKMKSGGMTASKRADGIATKGKTRGKMC